MIKDLLHLDIDLDLFYMQTMSDIEFINSMMDALTEKFLKNQKFVDRETDAENILDAEWQFSQLLSEITNNTGQYSLISFPQTQALISGFKKESASRKKLIEDSCTPADNAMTEPVVTHTELNGLLGGV